MRKNELTNKGIPLFVDKDKDMPGREGATFDSFFVDFEFEAEDGNRYGVVWHMQSQFGRFITAQVLLADPANAKYDNTGIAVEADDNTYISNSKLECVSSIATLTGNSREMHLKFEVENASGEFTLRPRETVLYNGTTGLLLFLSSMDNHQFAFPNMDVEGTLILNGTEHKVRNTTAWFDRQWGFADTSHDLLEGNGMNRLSWLWIGFPLNEAKTEAISCWDSYARDGRYAFATICNENGTQTNHKMEVTYKDIWTGKRSGASFPGAVHVSIPTAEIDFEMTVLPGNPEFYHPENGLCGFEALCKIDGTYKGDRIDRYCFLEIVGDCCGEI